MYPPLNGNAERLSKLKLFNPKSFRVGTKNSSSIKLSSCILVFSPKDCLTCNFFSQYLRKLVKTFETLFFDNVKITRLDEVMTGEKLYLVLENDDELVEKDLKKEQNILRMSNNILFEKPGYTLKADILEIDLITKNLKIYMNDKLEKVFGSSKIK